MKNSFVSFQVMQITSGIVCLIYIYIFPLVAFSFKFNLSMTEPKMPEGSWKCEQCNNINYPFRTKCNLPHCGAEKSSQTNNANDSGTDQDNQVCFSYIQYLPQNFPCLCLEHKVDC
jgi:hypothetical protein